MVSLKILAALLDPAQVDPAWIRSFVESPVVAIAFLVFVVVVVVGISVAALGAVLGGMLVQVLESHKKKLPIILFEWVFVGWWCQLRV